MTYAGCWLVFYVGTGWYENWGWLPYTLSVFYYLGKLSIELFKSILVKTMILYKLIIKINDKNFKLLFYYTIKFIYWVLYIF